MYKYLLINILLFNYDSALIALFTLLNNIMQGLFVPSQRQ